MKVVVGIQSSIVFCVNLRTERQALKHEVKGGDKVAVKKNSLEKFKICYPEE